MTMTMTIQFTTTIIVIVPLKVDLALRILGKHREVVE
jgi:hypothetical protein